uniref:Uncharacterized protein n=1 Tax=Arundo donax TaxID=35708 RepID=A0A0A8YLM0_ARUDO
MKKQRGIGIGCLLTPLYLADAEEEAVRRRRRDFGLRTAATLSFPGPARTAATLFSHVAARIDGQEKEVHHDEAASTHGHGGEQRDAFLDRCAWQGRARRRHFIPRCVPRRRAAACGGGAAARGGDECGRR